MSITTGRIDNKRLPSTINGSLNPPAEYKTPPKGGPSINPRPVNVSIAPVTVPILEPNSPATIANDAVSAAAPPIAITTRRRKQKTTKTVPLGSIDTNPNNICDPAQRNNPAVNVNLGPTVGS